MLEVKMRKQSLLAIILTGLLLLTGCAHNIPVMAPEPILKAAKKPPVKTGIDVLTEQRFDLLQGKRVGLVTNVTGVNRHLVSTVDILYHAPGVNLVALYGPEHGVRGAETAGAKIDSYTDPKTGLPVYSLYGKTRKPTPAMLDSIDILVYDIQDVGCRSYTYVSTMGLCMEACAEVGIPMMILDRPNPLGGIRIEGSVVKPGFFSFVSQFPIPYVYGLTPGELGLYLKNEGLIQAADKLDLTVVPMENWTRDMTFEDTGLEWVPTSPHIPHKYSPLYYVSSGVMGELSVVSEGVGYTAPFQFIGTEWANADSLAAALNAFNLPGVLFRPAVYKPYYGRDEGKYIHGVQVHIIDPDSLSLVLLQFYYLETLIRMYPDRNPFDLAAESRIRMFDKVMGSSEVRQVFSRAWKAADVAEFFRRDEAAFRKKAAQYYLYQ